MIEDSIFNIYKKILYKIINHFIYKFNKDFINIINLQFVNVQPISDPSWRFLIIYNSKFYTMSSSSSDSKKLIKYYTIITIL